MGCCMGRGMTSRKKVEPTHVKKSTASSHRKVERQRVPNKVVKCREVRMSAVIEQRYTIFSSIGKGEFGHVVRAEHNQSKIPYAIKIIELTKDAMGKANPHVELEILKRVKHDYVIRLHDVIKTSRRLYLVMDLATGGELMDRISLLGSFNEFDATRVLTMILDGLRYLHSLDITHRDLKPENILYYHPGNDSKIIITDFGLSSMRERTTDTSRFLMNTDCGTIEYVAPEVIMRTSYTNAVDMWSMGVIAYIVLSGRLPFPLNGNTFYTLRLICFGKFNYDGEPWSNISEDAKDFINSLLVYDASKRLTARQALQHKWIKGKHHFKLNLQKSISSNWSDSCVSLRNEKGLKPHKAKACDSANSGKNSGNSGKNSGNAAKGKAIYGVIARSCDDKPHKPSHGKTRLSEKPKGTSTNKADEQKDLDSSDCPVKGSRNPAKADTDETSAGEQMLGDVTKSILQNASSKPVSTEPQYPERNVKTRATVLKTDSDANATDTDCEGRRHLSSENSTESGLKHRGSKVCPGTGAETKRRGEKQNSCVTTNTVAQDCNGNVGTNFVKRVPSSTQHAGSRVDETTSPRRNLAEVNTDNETGHATERTPLKKDVRGYNRNTLLPPIKASVTPLPSLNNAIPLKT